jgi:16S rRNA (guanine(966)-N(2))-methyltransferase RsmD
VRIISGRHRGRLIRPPAQLPVRPTTDYAKTGLFNILNNYYRFDRIAVLDLFAGTGSLSYEFLSRGCEQITAIDKHSGCVNFIRCTFDLLEAPSGVNVIKADVISWLQRCSIQFDVIIADAPFAETPGEELVRIIAEKKLLKAGGCLIIEHVSTMELSQLPGFREKRSYGHVSFSFFELHDSGENC